jgi:lipoprotein NlpD
VNRSRSSRRRGASVAVAAIRILQLRHARHPWRLCLIALAFVATACTSTRSPYVLRRDEIPVHVVVRGETLYKIAWQHRVDQRDLVLWNGLADPDELRIGQRLRLVPPRGYVAPPPVQAANGSAPRPPAATVTPPRAQTTARSRATANRSVPAPVRPAAVSAPTWVWPTEGRVVTTFGASDGIASGIGIAGREGQPVRAAAAGRVVYAGGGLIGYGQLVIIKHDETFLSAYGYNSNVLVTQGQEITRGATIALMGQGPGRQPRLHFEIRRKGVPVDPLLFVDPPR